MRRIFASLFFALACLFICLPSALAQGQTHALLLACSDFISQPDLGAAISGNLHLVGSALISADVPLGSLSIEDGTVGTVEAFSAAVADAFQNADESDLSILYLCTHGVLSSSDDGQVYLLLGDGENESALSAQQLYELIAPIQGEKLLILDACYSGALIGRGQPEQGRLPGSHEEPFLSPFIMDSSIHVLTSANGYESSWYYDSDHLSTGAVSYFASALASSLGLYGAAEADLSGDGAVTLDELHRHLSVAVPSSSSQLLSTRAGALVLPTSSSAMLSRPLMGFSYGTSLLTTDDPALSFSFTVTKEETAVQYRLVDYKDGGWDWQNARTFLDDGDGGDGTLSPGRKNRTLSFDGLADGEGGYLMLQVFSVMDAELLLCSERLIAIQGGAGSEPLSLSCREDLRHPGTDELPIAAFLDVPAELTVSIYAEDGTLVRRLAASLLTRPTRDGVTHLYWDGRDDSGKPVPQGRYVIAAEARVGGARQKAVASVSVSAP